MQCKDPTWCYTMDEMCNNEVNCPDASDETGCIYKYRVLNFTCDGVYDAPDLSDERGCSGECQFGGLFCSRYLSCIGT